MSLFSKKKKTFEEEPEQIKVPEVQNTELAATPPQTTVKQTKQTNKPVKRQSMKKFDIIVYDEDLKDDGTPIYTPHPENGVTATSAKELRGLYAACGQKIEIVREYDDNAKIDVQKNITQVNNDISSIIGGKQIDLGQKAHESVNQQVPQQLKDAVHALFIEETTKKEKSKEPPRFFEIGGIKCKLEDGKMYQEQWVKVDSSKYRLVADSTNKLVSMNGKHLETLKWVQLEDDSSKGEDADA